MRRQPTNIQMVDDDDIQNGYTIPSAIIFNTLWNRIEIVQQ